MKVYKELLSHLGEKSKNSCSLIALIDPDKKNKNNLNSQIKYINSNSQFCAVFVGGSLIMDSNFKSRVEVIKESINLPVISFPASSGQINENFDAILFLSLISGRNPHYLIGEQVISSPIIYDLKKEVIPVGYILLDGGSCTAVEVISGTKSLPMDNHDIILAHALASQYLGHKFIYLECGSGANRYIDLDLLSAIKDCVDIPIIVGGGIKNHKDISRIATAGADFIVISSLIENIVNNESVY